ncbi:class I SAM-dependent methyltransferase [Halanaerobacter jeridensis]|uniref:Methyltransferase n=1 Tax=Halanaerobacter jeridensis TaxID=706427 RepID=A0A939BT03_9FIRM|nr:class I SAM-dependent methyltransferase [Halanaerobacter jeridensis]MBM7557706.1 putative methyltransferase [Halanaerobacter jeridensis]
MKDLKQGVDFSHNLIKEHINKGAKVIDATVGNGHDTQFLAEVVGAKGFVWGFDVQESALEAAKNRLQENELSERVKLIHAGHEKMQDYISENVDGILFNLGYLPGSNKEIITTVDTTLQAVKSGLELLAVGGLMIVVVYLGHEGGKKEQQALLDYAKKLDEKKYNVLHYRFINQSSQPPQVLAIKKRN